MTDRTINNPGIDDRTVRAGGDNGTVNGMSYDGTIANARVGNDGTIVEPRVDSTYRTSQGGDSEVTSSVFVLKGDTYQNLRCLSDNSGEAQVYLVERDGKEYVLKVYYPNFKVNKNLLKTVLNIDFEMIMHIYDYGKTYVDGASRTYELMEYLRGGTLNEFKLNGDFNHFRRIALQAAAALQYCHNMNILHKDIKPSNFFFRDENHEELVLGDFGISSMLEQDGKLHRTTQARTPIYAAPEMYSDVIDGVVEITPAADYYSLGMTLFALWLGENPMSSNERVMMRQKNEGRLPRLNELPDEVKHIIQGMTSVNPASRWKYEQVARWFQGEDVKVDISSPFLKYKSFIVDPDRNLVADNLHELIPMLVDNEKLAMRYLYGGRISQWLESCGNMKLSTVVKDIVVNRYPVDQKAGLMAAVYIMEPTYPYHDVKGNLCDDLHSVAISLLSYQDEYSILLTNPNDSLFLYLESHSKCDVNRIRKYFEVKPGATEDDIRAKARVAVMRTIYEIDPDIPFMAKHPSSTLKEIVHSFGYEDCSEDEWHSLCDGRLLSWMLCHEDQMACESLRIMTKGQPYSEQLAYKVLYNVCRDAAYDLREADTPDKVGQVLASQLVDCQNMSDGDFANTMACYTDENGRFTYYAQLHGWHEVIGEAHRCFDLKSEENRERLCNYDLKTAAYRFCRILGVTPKYRIDDTTWLEDGRSLPKAKQAAIRSELRNGSLSQWMSVFYHEDPAADFAEEFSYENTLVEWLTAMGAIDSQQKYFRRFVEARDLTARKMDDVRRRWKQSTARAKMWKYTFYGLCGLWILMVLIFGISGRGYLLGHSFFTIGVPLGGMSAVIIGTRAYFRGYGFMFSALWGALGALSSLLPILLLKYVGSNYPSLFNLTVVVITLAYMAICYFTDYHQDSTGDSKLVAEVFDDDIKTTLLEPLYYTFKTRSFRFKGSKFGVLDEAADEIRSASGESILHYLMWTLLILFFVLDFIMFSPKLMNVNNPDLNNWRLSPAKVITVLKHDVE